MTFWKWLRYLANCGAISQNCRPTASVAGMPVNRVAAVFHWVIRPSTSTEMIMEGMDSMMFRTRARLCFSRTVISLKRTANWPISSRATTCTWWSRLPWEITSTESTSRRMGRLMTRRTSTVSARAVMMMITKVPPSRSSRVWPSDRCIGSSDRPTTAVPIVRPCASRMAS